MDNLSKEEKEAQVNEPVSNDPRREIRAKVESNLSVRKIIVILILLFAIALIVPYIMGRYGHPKKSKLGKDSTKVEWMMGPNYSMKPDADTAKSQPSMFGPRIKVKR